MKGTIITGEEVLNLLSKGDFNEINNVYAIYMTGIINITPLVSEKIGAFINDYNNPNIIFIKIIKEKK